MESETEQSFSKSKSSTVRSIVSRKGQLRLMTCSVRVCVCVCVGMCVCGYVCVCVLLIPVPLLFNLGLFLGSVSSSLSSLQSSFTLLDILFCILLEQNRSLTLRAHVICSHERPDRAHVICSHKRLDRAHVMSFAATREQDEVRVPCRLSPNVRRSPFGERYS